jgi:hypothetical protein
VPHTTTLQVTHQLAGWLTGWWDGWPTACGRWSGLLVLQGGVGQAVGSALGQHSKNVPSRAHLLRSESLCLSASRLVHGPQSAVPQSALGENGDKLVPHPHLGCCAVLSAGGTKLTAAGFAHMTALLRTVAPLALLLEGGYNLAATSECVAWRGEEQRSTYRAASLAARGMSAQRSG